MFQLNEKDNLLKQQKILKKLLQKPENKYCADCKMPNPNWASLNIGIFICIKCCGCHRQLGVQISRIKSIDLDIWPEDSLELFQYINNQIANNYWEYNLNNYDFSKLRNNDSLLYKFIKMKYENKAFVKNINEYDPMTKIFIAKSQGKNINNMIHKDQMIENRNYNSNNNFYNNKRIDEMNNNNHFNNLKYMDNNLKNNSYGDEGVINYSSLNDFFNRNQNKDQITMNDMNQIAQEIVNNQKVDLKNGKNINNQYNNNLGQYNNYNIMNNNNFQNNNFNVNKNNFQRSNYTNNMNVNFNNLNQNGNYNNNNFQNYNSNSNNNNINNMQNYNSNNQQMNFSVRNYNQTFQVNTNQINNNIQQNFNQNISNNINNNLNNLNAQNNNLFNFNKMNSNLNNINDPFQQFL